MVPMSSREDVKVDLSTRGRYTPYCCEPCLIKATVECTREPTLTKAIFPAWISGLFITMVLVYPSGHFDINNVV